ncbi:CTK2 [Enterospora canceri]|uniref:CTK2 n=1 Tax=Enterospora canceri TaxID=1081671 RepID=A0A1Y1S8Y9_9MICR|nr:CTK2 [Enterospora canceri]
MQEHYLRELQNILRELSEQPIEQIEYSSKEVEEIKAENRLLKKQVAENDAVKNEVERLRDENEWLEKEAERIGRSEKRLRNEILDLKGNCRVYCRIHPESGTKMCYSDTQVQLENKAFKMDRVFGPGATQSEVYSEFDLFIENVMDGFSLCIFAYGQTGSGKTHTMLGNGDGLIYKSIQKIKRSLGKQEATCIASYVEVYNEKINDLFGGKAEYRIDELDQLILRMQEAGLKRATARTGCNETSSRSHALFVLEIEMQKENEIVRGALCLVDLAGSERISQSGVRDKRLKETQCINSSLSSLGNVFAAIKRKESHVPFRDSMLTRVMQPHLSENSRVVMVVNVNGSCENETLCTLRFATKVSECEMGVAKRSALRKC